MRDIPDGPPVERRGKERSGWLKSSLILAGAFAAYAAIAIAWHLYILTALPLAAAMRDVYLAVYPPPQGHLIAGLIDLAVPILLLGTIQGIAGGKLDGRFLLIHSLWIGVAVVAVMALCHSWLPPVDAAWLPRGWGWVPKAWASATVAVFVLAALCQRVFRLPAATNGLWPNGFWLSVLRLASTMDRRMRRP